MKLGFPIHNIQVDALRIASIGCISSLAERGHLRRKCASCTDADNVLSQETGYIFQRRLGCCETGFLRVTLGEIGPNGFFPSCTRWNRSDQCASHYVPMNQHDIDILRPLATRVAELSAEAANHEKEGLWSRMTDLDTSVRPLLLTHLFPPVAWEEALPDA